jgi:hypothetical protein
MELHKDHIWIIESKINGSYVCEFFETREQARSFLQTYMYPERVKKFKIVKYIREKNDQNYYPAGCFSF